MVFSQKIFAALFCCAFFASTLRAGDGQEVPSTIKEVTVFLQGAQVSRQANGVDIPSGSSTLRFVGLTAGLNPASIQLKADGNFTVLSVVHTLNSGQEPPKEADVKALEAKIKAIDEKIRAAADLRQVYLEEEAMLKANLVRPGGMSGNDNAVTAAQVREAADLYRARLIEIKQKVFEQDREIAAHNEEKAKFNKQLSEIRTVKYTNFSEVLVNVHAKSPVKGSFVLTYLVGNASWQPLYDIRVKDINSPISLTYRANVAQASGEDWKGVMLTLSTGNPSENAVRPVLQPWYLYPIQPMATLSEVTVMAGRAPAAPAQMYKADMDREQDFGAADRPNVAQVQNTTTLEFKIDIPYDILSDNKRYAVEMTEYSVPATYEYYVAPKLDPNAYLTAKVTGWEQYNLLNGEANLYFEGTFLGKSYLDLAQVADTLPISLGRDRNIVVERTRVKEKVKRQTLAGNRKETRGWEISLRNKKAVPVEIVVQDQFPVPTDQQIKVEDKEAPGAQVDEAKGLITWRLSLPANSNKKLSFGYMVKYPATYNVVLE
jgi:uncharacterized protein (TIGR02231 family)